MAGATGESTSATRKRAEARLQTSEERYQALFAAIDQGFCVIEMLFDAQERPIDYRFLEANAAMERHTGLRDPVGRRVRELVPNLDKSWYRIYGEVAFTRKAVRFENHEPALYRWFDVYAFPVGNPDKRQVGLLFSDISERKAAETALHRHADRLALLYDAAKALLAADNPADYIMRLSNRLAELLDLDIYAYFEVAPENTHLNLKACKGLDEAQRVRIERLEFGQGVCGKVAQELQALHVSAVQESADPAAEFIRSLGMTAYLCNPLVARGTLVGTLSFGSRTYSEFTEESVSLVRAVCDLAAMAIGRAQTEQELATELADTKRLQETSARLIPEGSTEGLLEEILDAAITISRADRGNIQLLNAAGDTLSIAAHRGFEPPFLDFFSRVTASDDSCCAASLRTGERVVISDMDASPHSLTPATREALLAADVLAVQSTPLVARSGKPVGIISTHWRHPHQPEERVLRLLDVLARQAADLIERYQAENALREREQHLSELSRSLEARVAERTEELQDQTQRLRMLAAELASAEQRERKRLAAMLHDDLQQLLIAAKLELSHAEGLLHDEEARQAVERARQRLQEAVAAARNMTRQLRPPILYEAGLMPALHWLASEMGSRHHLQVSVEPETAGQSLSDDTKALLFECVRELLFNVSKYAEVEQASVEVSESPGALRVVVSDKGKGFDVETVATRQYGDSFGLFSIRERLKALGGYMTITSGEGQGTHVVLEVPLPAEEASQGGETALDPIIIRGSDGAARTSGTTDQRIRVLIADDHALVRSGIASFLSADPGILVVAEAADGVEAVEATEQHQPEVVLMDINMPRMNGIAATRMIHQRWPETVIIGISVQQDAATAKAMLDAGAAAFVPKSGNADSVVSTILRLARTA